MKTILISGGHGDIGSEIVGKFKKESYRVISPASRDLDLRNKNEITKFLDNLDFNPDVLIHAAGINNPKPVEDNTQKDIDETFGINLIGFYQILQHFVPLWKERGSGHILLISSIYGTISRSKRSLYSMTKAALDSLARTLALELGEYNILVNSLSPGFVDTKLTRKNNTKELIVSLENDIPLGRLAYPKEIAEAAYFLCSDKNTYLTGQTIIVDGGYTAGGFQK
jgi:3-oxoacyl-[acyl-carrier protein] reductase